MMDLRSWETWGNKSVRSVNRPVRSVVISFAAGTLCGVMDARS